MESYILNGMHHSNKVQTHCTRIYIIQINCNKLLSLQSSGVLVGELQQGPAADNSRRSLSSSSPNNPHTHAQLSRESRSLTQAAILEKPSVGERADEVG